MYTHEDYIKDKIMAESGAKGWEADQARFRCYEYEHGRPYSANASFAKSEAGLQQKLNRIVAEEQQIHEYIRSYIGTEDFLYVQQQMEPKLKRLENTYREFDKFYKLQKRQNVPFKGIVKFILNT